MSRPDVLRLAMLVIAMVGCHGNDDGAAQGESSSSTAGPTSSASTSTTATTTSVDTGSASTIATATESSEASTAAESSTGTAAICGDGNLDPDELCDDGNTTAADGCSESCVPSGTVLWEVVYDDEVMGVDEGTGVELDSLGNILVGGLETVADQGLDILLQKRDATGALTWSRGHDGVASLDDFGYDAVVAPGDNPVIAGTAAPDMTTTNSFVRMYDPDGATVWTAIGELDSARGIAIAANGDVVVVGRIAEDLAVVRYAGADGMPVWTSTYDGVGNGEDQGVAVAIDGGGRVIAVGSATVGGGAAPDAAIVVFDDAGNQVWDRTFDGVGGSYDSWGGVAIADADTVVVAGYEQVVDLEGRVHAYSSDGADLLFASSFDDASVYNLSVARIDAAGDIVVCGAADDGGVEGSNRFFAKLDGDGNPRWTATLPGAGTEGCTELTIAPTGEIIVTGFVGDADDLWLAALVP